MRPLALTLLLVLLLLAPAFPTAHASPKPLRIALVDTGINASLPEFAAGQVVAWKDFTPANSPTPVDGFGHGTATASLVAGLNAGNCGDPSSPKISFAPGASLVIARVGDNSGSITGDIEAAIDWAVAQGADVVPMSIGTIVPVPLPSAAIARAHAAGVIVVVAAGNGVANFGLVPFPAWSSEYGVNSGAIAVGSASHSGTAITLTGNTDPDVASWSENVCVAQRTGGYAKETGTSFATPLVAGMAGKAIEIARANAQPADAAHITQLVLYAAKNSPTLPYAREGMGFLLDAQWSVIQADAANGSIPNYDAQGAWATADRAYREQVLMPARGEIGIL